jgi:diaminohydroxyphosphoribosylaminopyrimidine deaminase/5-amino-6-(5-phosphoribosylamino)uracil reductase
MSAALVKSARVTPTWVIAREDASQHAQARLEAQGVTIIRVGANELGRVDISQAAQALGARGVTSLMCEGGPALAEELAKSDLIDEFVLITSSRELGRPGLAALGATLSKTLYRNFAVAGEPLIFGEDRFIRYLKARPCSPAL